MKNSLMTQELFGLFSGTFEIPPHTVPKMLQPLTFYPERLHLDRVFNCGLRQPSPTLDKHPCTRRL